MKVLHFSTKFLKLAVLCFDGLEPSLVEKFNIESLMQVEHGRTDTEGITRQTPPLWSSFLTGRRDHGVTGGVVERDYFKKQGMHSLSDIDNCLCLNMPPIMPWGQYLNAFVYGAFDGSVPYDLFLEKEYQWYESEKKATLEAIRTRNAMVISHFIISDHVGHVFRIEDNIMSELYNKLGEFVEEVQRYIKGAVLVLSDHGMEPRTPSSRGKYGYHARHGFYSINEQWNLSNPVHITKFHDIIMNYLGRDNHDA